MNVKPEEMQEILNTRNDTSETYRPTSFGLEGCLHMPTPVLDHGFVRVVDYMGDDAAIVQAARVSYGRGTKKASDDRALIRYLMRHRHTTPFEMCEIKLHVKLLIFVARQWIRHRTASVNEYSARYSILDREFYIPRPEHLASQSGINNQGRGDILDKEDAEEVLEIFEEDSKQCYNNYDYMAQDMSLTRELARINLPINIYTQWYWKIDLHNLFHFMALRMDGHAQYEIRTYADAISEIVSKWVPEAYGAFEEYVLNGTHLSKTAIDTISKLLAGEKIDKSVMSEREWADLIRVFGDINT